MLRYLLLVIMFSFFSFANIPPLTTSSTYDAMDNLLSQTNQEGETTSYAYDDADRLISTTYPNSDTITYTYDEAGNITLIETPTQSISKTYDALNRLSTVTDSSGTTTYTYDALGRQTQISYPNGITTNYSYVSRNRIVKIQHKDSNAAVLQSFTYTLDAVGNRTQIVEHSGRTVDYTYNTVNQLTKETVTNDPNGVNTTTTFTYDDVGNLVTKTIDSIQTDYTYNTNDQLETKGSISYTYDSNGNLISDNNNTYTYDDKNRLITVTTPTDSIEYSYDANDNRVAKITSNGTTSYLIDVNTPYAQVITENKADGTTIEYTYGNDLLSDGTHSFLTDALGSTRGLVDSSEALTDSYAYTPYGELANHEGASENSFLFTGEQLDFETSNYYLRARYYSPNSSRFLSRDTYDGTMDSPVSQNHYLYAGSNPSMYVDPSGHMSMMEINMVNNVIGSVGRISMNFARIGGIISDAEILVTSYNSVSALTKASKLFANFDGNLMGDPEFKKAMENYQEGMSVLIANAGRIVMRLARGKARKKILNSFIGNNK